MLGEVVAVAAVVAVKAGTHFVVNWGPADDADVVGKGAIQKLGVVDFVL